MKGPFNKAGRPAATMLVLSGLDGSGKSTQAALLAGRLAASGIRSRAVWNRWEPFFSAPFIRLAKRYLARRENAGTGDYRGFTAAKRRKMKSRWKREVWQLMAWSEYAFQVHGRTLMRRLSGATVICDRYVYDTLIDIAINFSIAPSDLPALMGHPLLAFFPKPALVIFIDIDPETGASRKSDGTPAAYLADRRPYYSELARIMNAPLLDGGASVESVADSVWRLTGDWRSKIGKGALPRGGSTEP
jgi:thymidylate kinase